MIDLLRVTWIKIRTWDAIQSRHRAGESAESLAHDYGLPRDFVDFVLAPENDLDARYARPSDRTATVKADRNRLDAILRKLVIGYDAGQDEEFSEALAAAREEFGFVLADDADAVLTELQHAHDLDAAAETDQP